MLSTSRSPASCPAAGPEVVFRLFACCIAVRGARRSVICDLGRHLLRFIPNGLYEILTEHGDKNVAELKAFYDGRYDREIDEYFDFLLREELGFWCDEPAAFPPLTLDWESPQRITNAILDVDRASTHDYPAILAQLDDLGCEALQVRCYEPLDRAVVERMLAATVRGRLRSIELLLAHEPALTAEALADLCLRHPRIWRICVHSAPEDRACAPTAGGAEIAYVREVVGSPSCCGCVDPSYFALNVETFLEAQRHNTCLNRKVAVDARGEIRNCPSLGMSYGNVRDVSLHSAVARRDFRELWEVNKDQIEVCKDCEFRYVCVDCRAYLTRPEDRYAKPAKCGYDPYTAQWS
jgi:SPASM domain peptide maturase of grasp-with-spasm system